MAEEIVNKVAGSALVQIDLGEYLDRIEVVEYDLSQNLFEGMILREKDFRAFIKDHNWEQYREKGVAIHCGADAIIPNWAFMLLSSKLQQVNAIGIYGSKNQVREALLLKSFRESGLEGFKDKKVLVKGCGSFELSPSAYVEVTRMLQPLVNSLMFGEACSSVPVYKFGKG